MHAFYHKDIASRAVINAKSAVTWKDKRTILTQEILRVLRNCSRHTRWAVKGVRGGIWGRHLGMPSPEVYNTRLTWGRWMRRAHCTSTTERNTGMNLHQDLKCVWQVFLVGSDDTNRQRVFLVGSDATNRQVRESVLIQKTDEEKLIKTGGTSGDRSSCHGSGWIYHDRLHGEPAPLAGPCPDDVTEVNNRQDVRDWRGNWHSSRRPSWPKIQRWKLMIVKQQKAVWNVIFYK